MNQAYARISFLLFSLLLFSVNLAAQPVPEITESSPDENFINETFCFDYTFNLSGDPGYGPYVRIMLPPNLTLESTEFLNGAISYTKVGVIPAGGKIEDPISLDSLSAADGAVVGDTFFIVVLPVGSVVATTPEMELSLCVSFNDEATIDSNYQFVLQPGLQYGDTPTGENGAVYGTSVTGQIAPVLVNFTKINNARENERAPGPDWEYTYTLAIDVADEKTLTSLVFGDQLSTNLTYVGNLTITGGTGCAAMYTPGTRTVSATCTSVTGTTGDGEVTITFGVHANDILDEGSCATLGIYNAADFEAVFDGAPVTPDSASDNVTIKHLPLQVDVSPSSVTPDDTVTYTTNFQVTNFDSTSGNLNPVSSYTITQYLPLGFSYDASTAATIALSGGSTLAATSITPTVDTLTNDTIRLIFDIHAITGNINQGTSGTLIYKAILRQHYDIAASDPVLANDILPLTTTSSYTLNGKATGCSDASSASVIVTGSSPGLTIVNSPDNGACYVPREVITIKMTLDVSSGDAENIVFQNFFPLPVFDVSDVDTDNFGPGFNIRLAGDHSDGSFVPLTADISKNVSQNSITIEWPDLEGPTSNQVLSVLVDIPIDYQPFADELSLSDLFRYEITSSSGEVEDSIIIRYVNICAPDLSISKGVTAISGDGEITPTPGSLPELSNATGVDAGDTISFRLMVVNDGGTRAYDIAVKDTFTAGFMNCDTVLTNPVSYASGTAVAAAGYSGHPFETGGIVIDSIFASGDASKRDTLLIDCYCLVADSVQPNQRQQNKVIVDWNAAPIAEEPTVTSYDPIADSVYAETARLAISKSISSISPNGSGDADIVAPGDTVTYAISAQLIEGEIDGLIISDTLPEGFAFVTGSAVVSTASFAGTVTSSPTISTSGTGASGSQQTVTFTFGDVIIDDDNDVNTDLVVLSLKAVARDNAANNGLGSLQEKINQTELTYTDKSSDPTTGADTTELGEPDLAITVDLTPGTSLDGGDQVTVTITLDNNGTTPAYDVTVTENLDGLDDFFDLLSVANTTGPMGAWAFNQIGSVVTYSLTGTDNLAAGGQQIFTFTVDLDDNVEPRTTYENGVSVAGSSQPGTPTEDRSTTDSGTDDLTTSDPSISKSIVAVSPDATNTSGTQVTAGDTITYRVAVTLTEGTTTALEIEETLPLGFTYVGSSLVVDDSGYDGTVTTSPSVSTAGDGTSGTPVVVTVDFGNPVTNGDNNGSDNDFSFDFKAVVAGSLNENDGIPSAQTKTNAVALTSTSVTGLPAIEGTDATDFVEPNMVIAKAMDVATADAGDTVEVTLTVQNDGTAPAFDIVVTDTLDTDLFDVSTIHDISATGFTDESAGATMKFTRDSVLHDIASKEISFKVAVKAGVITGTSFTNSGNVWANSQDGDPGPGEKRESSDSDSQSINTIGIPVIDKVVTSTSDANSGSDLYTIGEIVTYQLEITFPEGETSEDASLAMVTDTLPVGLQFIDAAYTGGTHSARISSVADYVNGINSANLGDIDGTPVVFNASFLTVSGTPSTGQILEFDLGDVTNSDNLVPGDMDAEQLIISLEAIVLNTADNGIADNKINDLVLSYESGDGSPLTDDVSHTGTIIEPELAVTTSTSAPGGSLSGMETATFTTHFYNSDNANTATAYDLNFSDDLPDGYFTSGAGGGQQPVLVSATYTGDDSDVSACFEWGGDGNELIFDASNGGCALDSLNPGDSLTIVYSAVVDTLAQLNSDLTRDPLGAGTSLTGATGFSSSGGNDASTAGGDQGERTGSGANNDSGQATNDLSATASDTETLDEPVVTKTGDTNLAVGDSTMFTVSIEIPSGTMEQFTLTDNLPGRATLTGDEIAIVIPAGVFADTPEPSVSSGDDPAIWNFGTVTNTNSSSSTLTITYEVEVRNVNGSQAGNTARNNAGLTFTGSSGAGTLDDRATITIIEPDMEILITDGGGSYGAGSTIPYTIRIVNDGTATAYGVDFNSVLPASLLGGSSPFYDNLVITNSGGTVVQTGTGTAISGSDVSFSTSANANDQLNLANFDMPAGDTLFITFDATVINTVTAGSSQTINSELDYNSLLNDDSRGRDNSTDPGNVDDDEDNDLNNYEETGSITTDLDATIAIVKALSSIHADDEFTVGDTLEYEIRVAVPEGELTSVVVTDSLVDGLGFISSTLSLPGNISAAMSDDGVTNQPGKVTMTIGTVTNTADGDATNDTIRILFRTQVLDDGTEINSGDSKDNVAKVTSSINPTAQVSNTLSIDIVEPALSITVTPSTATPSLDEIVTITIDIENTGGETAHDITLASLLASLDLTYAGGFTAGASGFSIDATDTDSLSFTLDSLSATGSVSFTFDVRVDSAAVLGTDMTLTTGFTGAYSSQSGDPSGDWTERTYDLSGSTVITPELHSIDAQKIVVNEDDVTSDGILEPGETLTYSIYLDNTTGRALTNVVFTDAIPTYTTFVSSSLTTTSGSVDESGDPLLSVSVGTMSIGAKDTITFEVTVDAGADDGLVISNQGIVDANETEPEPTDVDGIDANGDQPTDIMVGTRPVLVNDLYSQKLVTWLTDTDASDDVTATDIMRYTFILENTGPAQLTNVTLSDEIPVGLTFSAAGTPSDGSFSTGAFPSVSWTGVTLDVGEIATVTLDVSIDVFVGVDSTFTNQGEIDSDQTEESLTDANGNYSDGLQETTFEAVNSGTAAPELDLEKRWEISLDDDEDGLVDPDDQFVYTLILRNTGSATSENTVIRDTLPEGLALAGDSVLVSQGLITSELSDDIEVSFGPLAPGGIATMTIEVAVDGDVLDGTLLENQAYVTASNVNSGTAEPSDDNGEDGDGKNPTITPVYTGASTLDASDITKVLSTTSEVSSSGTDALIGEVLDYKISLVVPRGSLKEVSLNDDLPAGLDYVAGSAKLSRIFGTGLNASLDPAGINSAASGVQVTLVDDTDIIQTGNTLSVLLGDVINSDQDTGPVTDEVYELDLQVVVANESGIGNYGGASLSNAGSVSYIDGLNSLGGLSVSSNPSVSVIEPNVGISKIASDDWILTAGGTIEYSLTVINPALANTATAFDVTVTDTLPVIAGTWETITIESSTALGNAGALSNVSTLGSGYVTFTVDSIPAGGLVVITIRATADGTPELLTTADALDNTAFVYATSLPGTNGTGSTTPGVPGAINGERTSSGDYPDSDLVASSTTEMDVYDLEINKSVINPLAQYTMGDSVRYELEIPVPDGVSITNAVIRETMPTGLAYISGSLAAQSGNDYPATLLSSPAAEFTTINSGPDTLTISLGSIANATGSADTILLTYQASVENELVNQYDAGAGTGNELENEVYLEFDNPIHPDAAFADQLKDSASVEVGEPHLDVDYSITSGSQLRGSTMSFSITVTNDGNMPMYDLILANATTTDLENISSLVVSGTTGGATGPGGFTNNGTDWTSNAFNLPVGGSVTITWTEDIADEAAYGPMTVNAITMSYSNQVGGANPEERTAVDGSDQDTDGVLNNYNLSVNPSSSLTVFPIEMTGFTAAWLEDDRVNAQVSWETTLEINNDRFEIQRSFDGTEWELAGSVKGAGNSTEAIEYEFTDQGVGYKTNGNEVYYRLKQVDLNGQFSLSAPVVLQTAPFEFEVKVWPNPFGDQLTVNWRGEQEVKEILLIDGAGREIFTRKIDGSRVFEETFYQLDSLAEGIYFLRVMTMNGETHLVKVSRIQ